MPPASLAGCIPPAPDHTLAQPHVKSLASHHHFHYLPTSPLIYHNHIATNITKVFSLTMIFTLLTTITAYYIPHIRRQSACPTTGDACGWYILPGADGQNCTSYPPLTPAPILPRKDVNKYKKQAQQKQP